MMRTHSTRFLVLCLITVLAAVLPLVSLAEGGAVITQDGKNAAIKAGQTPSPNQNLANEYFDEMFAQYGDFRDWPYDIKAQSSQKLAELGLDQGGVVFGLPGASDIAESEAIEITKTATAEKYNLTEATMKLFRTGTSYIVATPNLWSVEFYPINEGDYSEIGTYVVHIDAAKGNVTEITSAADAVG